MDYLDFELKIILSGQEYEVIVKSPAGETRKGMKFFDEAALIKHKKNLQSILLRSGEKRGQVLASEEQIIKDFGMFLFDALVTDEICSLYDRSMERARGNRNGLRLKLNIQPPELSMLPWELMYDSRQEDYVCLSYRSPIVRYMELPQSIEPLNVKPPLHILGMIASPGDLEQLDVRREKQLVEDAIKKLRNSVDVNWINGTSDDLQRAIWSGKWHIFHFIGHGGFNSDTNEGFITLVNKEGKKEPLSATMLATLLSDHNDLRLVMLCSSGRVQGSESDIFSSTAATLVHRGIPAVLVMQNEISDEAAIQFTQTFYGALMEGIPIDASLVEARKAIYLKALEWGTPVLYMRSPDGVLFNIKKSAVSESAPISSIENLIVLFNRSTSISDWNKVIELGESILAKDETQKTIRSETAEAYMLWGKKYAEGKNYNRAIDKFNRAIELEPNKADYYFERGMCYASTGDHRSAIGNFIRAIKINPNKAVYYFNQGKSYAIMGNYDRAIENFTFAININPAIADYYFNRGMSYANKGENDRAILDYNSAIELDPKKFDYYYSRSIGYAKEDNYQKSSDDYEHAIQLDSYSADYYFNRGLSYTEKGDYDKAIIDFDRSIQLDPNKADYYYSRSLCYTNKGDYDKATEDFERAIQLDPQKVDYLLNALRQHRKL